MTLAYRYKGTGFTIDTHVVGESEADMLRRILADQQRADKPGRALLVSQVRLVRALERARTAQSLDGLSEAVVDALQEMAKVTHQLEPL